jgi:hypothetical protein
MNPAADRIARALDPKAKHVNGSWSCRCPAHEDPRQDRRWREPRAAAAAAIPLPGPLPPRALTPRHNGTCAFPPCVRGRRSASAARSASVASHSVSNRTIWLVEAAGRSMPSRPTIARIAGSSAKCPASFTSS